MAVGACASAGRAAETTAVATVDTPTVLKKSRRETEEAGASGDAGVGGEDSREAITGLLLATRVRKERQE
jgi:hypothetical protein